MFVDVFLKLNIHFIVNSQVDYTYYAINIITSEYRWLNESLTTIPRYMCLKSKPRANPPNRSCQTQIISTSLIEYVYPAWASKKKHHSFSRILYDVCPRYESIQFKSNYFGQKLSTKWKPATVCTRFRAMLFFTIPQTKTGEGMTLFQQIWMLYKNFP